MGTRLIKRAERLLVIEQMLFRSSMGLRAVEIADACEVDRRTVYRDLAMLNNIGVPVYQKDGRFYIKREYYLATVRLNTSEIMALFIASRFLSHHAEQQNPYIVSALTKLSAALPGPLAAHLSFTAESVLGNPVDRGFIAILETITRAWSERRKVKLWYRSTNGQETIAREFSTYFIEPTASGAVYAVGLDEFYGRVRPLKLQRVKRAKLLPSSYEIPTRFDPRRYLVASWGVTEGDTDDKVEVRLLFSADVAPLIKERAYGNDTNIDVLGDNRCILHIQVSDWREMLAWVRSWGSQVEVLDPPALREELAKDAERVQALYQVKV